MCIGQVGGVAVAQHEKCAEQNEERERREYREGSPFEAKALPKDGCKAERAEPEQVNPVGDGGAAADEDQNDYGKEEINRQRRTLRFAVRRTVNCFGHFPPHSGEKCAL